MRRLSLLLEGTWVTDYERSIILMLLVTKMLRSWVIIAHCTANTNRFTVCVGIVNVIHIPVMVCTFTDQFFEHVCFIFQHENWLLVHWSFLCTWAVFGMYLAGVQGWCRIQLKCDGTQWRMGGEVKGKLANGVGSQYSSHYLGTWCIQCYYRWHAHLGCQ
jgi:hypothetical protein